MDTKKDFSAGNSQGKVYRKFTLSRDLKEKIRQKLGGKINENIPKLILLITIDSLRADYVGYYDSKHNCTPNIDKLAKEGAVFLNAFTNCSATRGAFPNIFYSNYQWEVYDKKTGKIKKGLPCLQESLKPKYKTISIHANPYISRYFGWEYGFEIFDDSLIFKSKSKNNIVGALKWLFTEKYAFKQGSADQMFDLFIKYFEKYKSNNIFIHLHFMDPHEPLLPPCRFLDEDEVNLFRRLKALYHAHKLLKNKSYIKKMSHVDVDILINLYKAEIRYSDYYIGKIIEYLKDEGILENSLIILTADHGQEFGEHGMYVHGRAYEEVIRVPLIFYSPDKIPHKEINQIVQHMDIAPTVLDFLEIPIPSFFYGTSLWPLINGDSEIRDREIIIQNTLFSGFEKTFYGKPRIYWAVRGNRYKYILTQNVDMKTIEEELYDLKSDPSEKVNIARSRPEIVEYLRNYLKRGIPEITEYNKNILS